MARQHYYKMLLLKSTSELDPHWEGIYDTREEVNKKFAYWLSADDIQGRIKIYRVQRSPAFGEQVDELVSYDK